MAERRVILMVLTKKAKRKYSWKERKLTTDYLWEFYRGFPPWRNIRLGVAKDAETANLYKVSMRRADAIIFTGDELILIEAKMGNDLRGLTQLEEYAKLIPKTPEFDMYKYYPIRQVFLTSREYKDMRRLCEEKGYIYVVYQPPWVKEYWRERGFSI